MSRYVLEIEKHGTLKMQDMYRIRGLEHIDRDIARVLLLGRRMAIDGVLREQARQNELGVHDIARIAYMSTKYYNCCPLKSLAANSTVIHLLLKNVWLISEL